MPGHQYQRSFSSANGKTSVQVVSMDSTPLHDRYLYSGASGGGYATSFAGVADPAGVNNPAAAIVLNPGVTAANGFTNGNYFNASNYQCYYNLSAAGSVAAANGTSFTYFYVNSLPYPGTTASKPSSGCKYASSELALGATPAARAAAYASASGYLESGLGSNQYQVLFSHFPILSSQQRLTVRARCCVEPCARLSFCGSCSRCLTLFFVPQPWYDNATAMFAALGPAAPQICAWPWVKGLLSHFFLTIRLADFNGHDHVLAQVSNPAITTVTTAGVTPIQFVTTGAAGR